MAALELSKQLQKSVTDLVLFLNIYAISSQCKFDFLNQTVMIILTRSTEFRLGNELPMCKPRTRIIVNYVCSSEVLKIILLILQVREIDYLFGLLTAGKDALGKKMKNDIVWATQDVKANLSESLLDF